jgi:hypothetical protein
MTTSGQGAGCTSDPLPRPDHVCYYGSAMVDCWDDPAWDQMAMADLSLGPDLQQGSMEPPDLSGQDEPPELFDAQGIVDWIGKFFPNLAAEDEVEALVLEAYKYGSSVYGVDAARTWADGFTIPDAAVQQDSESWHHCGENFVSMIDSKKQAIASTRLSHERIDQCISEDNPDKSRLHLLVEGMDPFPAPDFVGCTYSDRPTLSRRFNETAAAVERMFFESYWNDGLAVILHGDQVEKIDGLALCLAGWAPKHGKACGRPITNGSGRRGMDPKHYLNSQYTKDKANEVWGVIKHSTIGDVARTAVIYAREKQLPRKKLVFWKFDLRKAYLLLSYSSTSVSKVGVELRDNLLKFFIGGVFGLTGCPWCSRWSPEPLCLR